MRNWRCRGFTVVELTITIVLVGILATVGIAMMPNLSAGRTEAATTKIASDLSYARDLARNRNGIFGISFDTAANRYTVHSYDPATGLETAIIDPLTQTAMTINLATWPGASGIDLTTADFGGTAKIRFLPAGTPVNANSIALASAGTITVFENGSTRSIKIEPRTGEVSMP